MHITLTVEINRDKPSQTLSQAIKKVLKGYDFHVSVTIKKGFETDYGAYKHHVALSSEMDLDFEFLQALHKELRSTPTVVSYVVTSFYHSFYIEHGHGL